MGVRTIKVLINEDGTVEFLIRFPLDVAIAYTGIVTEAETHSAGVITGTWQQHAEGLFGADDGDWTVPFTTVYQPN